MSLVNDNDEKVYVATYKEIILLFIAFSVILVILYPKDLLKNELLKGTSSDNLSMVYLKNMLKQDPSNESLILLIINSNYKSGKYDPNYPLLERLLSSKNPIIRKNAYLLAYRLSKESYYATQDVKRKSELKIRLTDLFKGIVDNRYYSQETLDQFYKESQFLGLTSYTYLLLKDKIAYHPDDYKLLADAYYLADKLGYQPEVINYLDLLRSKDTANQDRWITEEYNYYMKKNELKDAEQLLKSYAQNSSAWAQKLAEFYLATESFEEASQTYMQLYNRSDIYNSKKRYFIEALKALEAGTLMAKAADLGARYEDRFLDDREVRVFLLKLYLAANDLKKANNLSQKILTRKTK